MESAGGSYGVSRARARTVVIGGVVLMITLAVWVAPGELWLRRELKSIATMSDEVQRLGGSAEIPAGGIDVGERHVHVIIDLSGTSVGDGDVARLAGMAAFRHVRSISLERTRITDRALRPLEGNSSLMTVNLSSSGITDEGMKSVATLPYVNNLRLAKTAVSDRGIDDLVERRAFLSIRSMDLDGTRVTAQGVRRLRAAFDLIVFDHSDALAPSRGEP